MNYTICDKDSDKGKGKRSTYVRPASRIRRALCIGALTGAVLSVGAVTGAIVQANHDGAAMAALKASVQHAETVQAQAVEQARRGQDADRKAPANSAYGNHLTILPCLEEDSNNCVWNAGDKGNGDGYSFIAYRGEVYYLETEAMDRAMGW